MTLHSFVDQSYNAFLEYAGNNKVILLHPRSKYRSVVVAKLLAAPDIDTVYYALGPDDLDLKSFINAMTHDIAYQHTLFGRNVNMLDESIYDSSAGLDTLVQTFAKDISEIGDGDFLFILDEYDRSDTADDIQRFVEKLIAHLPSNCRMVINSRTLPRIAWLSLIARDMAVMLLDDKPIKQNHHELTLQSKNHLEVTAFGPGHVLMNGNEISSWEGHLPRLLFFFGLDRPVVTRSEICDAFWPDLETEQAVNVFHVTKRRLHKALDMDVLVHESGYYHVNADLGISYDLMEFVAALAEGRNESLDMKSRMKAWSRAIELYIGPFLQGHSDKWILERREEYKIGYMEALVSMAAVRNEEGRKEHALNLYLKVLGEDNTREDIHCEVMRLYADMGRRSEVAAHYKTLKSPSAETTALYKELME